MAALVSHIPDRGGQTVRYYGAYSNVTRGRLKKEKGEPESIISQRTIVPLGLTGPGLGLYRRYMKWTHDMSPMREKDENNHLHLR